MENRLFVIPYKLSLKRLKLKQQINDINRKIKELDVIESKIVSGDYLLTSDVNKTIDVKDFLDNLVTINTKEIASDTDNPYDGLNLKVIESIEESDYKPGDEFKFYMLDKEIGYLKPTGYTFKLKKKIFKEYDTNIEEEYNEYMSVCNYLYALKSKLLNEYIYDGIVYFTTNGSKEVTKLIIKR